MNENAQQNKNYSLVKTLAIISISIFLLTCILGEGLGGSLASNPSCYKYIGCTTGFAGYDAIEHFLFGIGAVFTIIYLFNKFKKYSLFTDIKWKNILILIILVMFISVIWEFYEFVLDMFRFNILHFSFANWKENFNLLDQPSNTDTMGDLFFVLVGSVIAAFFTKFNNLKK